MPKQSKAVDVFMNKYMEFNAHMYPSYPPNYMGRPNCLSRKNKTNGLTACIVEFLKYMGWNASRINNMGTRVDNRKTVTDVVGFRKEIGSVEWRKSTQQKGIADVTSTIDGKRVEIEVKNKATKDRMSPDQVRYKNMIEASGGVYVVATDFDQIIMYLYDNYDDNPNKELFWDFVKRDKEN